MRTRTTLKKPSSISRKGIGQLVDRGMRLSVNALPNPCYVVDERGTTLFANRVAQERFGVIASGDPLSFRLRAPSLLEALDRVSHGGEPESIEWSEKVPIELWLEAYISPMRSSSNKGEGGKRQQAEPILVVIRDFTETKRLEKMRADFVANASHELRTPLASLTGFIETIQGAAKDDEAARSKFLSIMLNQAERMRRLIDDLLSLSRIEMKEHVQPDQIIDLRTIIEHSVDGLSPLAEEMGVKLSLKIPDDFVSVRGERDELIQVVNNLVENALKYGETGKRVDVSVEADKAAASVKGGWCITVRDYGQGIAEEHLPRLTERFYRVDTQTSRQKKGTGLGLAIVKHILTRHRARLEVSSTLGEGTAFRVYIPAASKLLIEA